MAAVTHRTSLHLYHANPYSLPVWTAATRPIEERYRMTATETEREKLADAPTPYFAARLDAIRAEMHRDDAWKWVVPGDLRLLVGEIDRLRTIPASAGEWAPTHRHYKGGLYQLIGYGKFEGNLAEAAVYRAEDGTLWVRTRMIFDGVVEMEHGEEIRRFEPISAAPPPAGRDRRVR